MSWDEHRPYRVPGPLIPEGLIAFFLAGLLLLVGSVGMIFFGQWIESRSCAEVTSVTGIPTRFSYGLGSQCFVKVDGRWIPRSAWREVP